MGLSVMRLLPIFLGALAGLISDELAVQAPMVVEAKVGATAILNCTFHPPAKDLILYWTRLDSAGGISSVYIHYQGKVDTRFTDPTYVTRSSLVGDLDKGDASLRLGPLSPADRGTYCCRVKHAHGTDVAETQLHVLNSSRLDTPWTLQVDPSGLTDTTAPPSTRPWLDANANSTWVWVAGLGGGAVVVLGVLWGWHRRRMHGGTLASPPPQLSAPH
ncbi:hypothetical protein Y1Q_0019598 [Alligator mississippiensis]|uniref:Ig-like domain-containing protein n=1 Tax=Alligator mississippiensis TaxID=8496 RepID=A0A151NW10_ALLMI|nr:hypothetical protein Y1Q_0019598 [Alligator mississippiensis]